MENSLLKLNEQICHRFNLAKEGRVFDFHDEIEPFVHHVDEMMLYLHDKQSQICALPYFNDHKLQQLIKLIEEVSVECHYPSTSKKLFLEKMKVIHHDLTYIQQKGELPHV
ncbi:YppE family protein [Staphylococcus chromogenes]|uniref:DUF1798 family protein n=1 Tax=Staphylococcus TaxID=1279 RepID=UPI001E6352CC|nr:MULTISPECIES: DUF1798 family protein [Staphylococcus]MCD8905549.1 YppE family protein [Staphylococcus chromogenes]UOC14225.1 YppE family protein [Staphylococcus agnetis]